MSLDIYGEQLINAYEHPQHKGRIDGNVVDMHEENISCGDKITMHLLIEGGEVKDAKFEGTGCVISMGSAEYLCDALRGMKLDEIEAKGKDYIIELINIDPGPVRMHCATLSLRAAKKAAFEYDGKPIDVLTKEL